MNHARLDRTIGLNNTLLRLLDDLTLAAAIDLADRARLSRLRSRPGAATRDDALFIVRLARRLGLTR